MKPRWCTIVPVANLEADDEAITFGHRVSLIQTPDWVRTDPWLEKLSKRARRAVRSSRNALVVFSGASSLGIPDKRWKDPNDEKSVQDLHYELCLMANLALWLGRPSPACLVHAFHAFRRDGAWVIQGSNRTSRFLCHPRDEKQRLTKNDIVSAGELHSELSTLHIRQRMWTPASTTIASLQMSSEPIRYLLLWNSLESIFGSDDPYELSYRLALRIGLFLGRDRAVASRLFKIANAGCSMRSDIAHGRWKRGPKTRNLMFETEGLVRQSLVRILSQ